MAKLVGGVEEEGGGAGDAGLEGLDVHCGRRAGDAEP